MKTKLTFLTIMLSILFFNCTNSQIKTDEKSIAIGILDKWNKFHNEKDVISLSKIYNENVFYYGQKKSLKYITKNKTQLFEKFQSFIQENIGIDAIAKDLMNDEIKISFTKKVTINNKVSNYPSYLILKKDNDIWKITTEGDSITDENLKKKTFGKTESKSNKTKLESFMSGLKNPKIISLKEVSNGVEYKLNYSYKLDDHVKLKIKRKNNKNLELSINYGDDIKIVLPFEFYTTFYGSGTYRELRKENKDDEYMIGQHDFDNNGIDEIVVGLKSRFDRTESYGVHFYVYKYLPPTNKKENYSIENWKVFGSYEAFEVLEGTKVKIEGNKISTTITADGDLFEEWIFENGDFIRNGQI